MMPSASPRTWKSALRRRAGLEVASGPPIATGLPRARHRSMIVERVALLRQHAAGHDQVGPVEVGVGERPRCCGRPAATVQARRQHRRDGDQAERRRSDSAPRKARRPPGSSRTHRSQSADRPEARSWIAPLAREKSPFLQPIRCGADLRVGARSSPLPGLRRAPAFWVRAPYTARSRSRHRQALEQCGEPGEKLSPRAKSDLE